MFIFAVCWKSLILKEQDLEYIKDNNILTHFTMNKSHCSNIELWADKLEVNSSIEVNVTGIGIRCDSTHPVIRAIEVTTAINMYGKHTECRMTTALTGNMLDSLVT